jgi:hypothetical protein
MEVTRRWGRRRKKLPDELRDRRGYCHLKEEALDRTVWRKRFGRGFGPVVSQTEYWINECTASCWSCCTGDTQLFNDQCNFLLCFIYHHIRTFQSNRVSGVTWPNQQCNL